MDATGFKGSEVIDGLSDELEAVATELGANPSGSSATVAARLDGVDTALSGKAATVHSHTTSDVTGLDTALAGKAASSHSHVAADVTDLGDAALLDVGTTTGTVAAGDHAHSGVYDPAGTAAALVDDLSGVTDQATARTNLGLGSAAVADTGDFEAAGAVATHTGDASDAHDASAISVDASGFNGNLTTSDDTVQKVAQKVDDLALGGSSAGIVALHTSGTPTGGSNGDWSALIADLDVASSEPGLDGRLFRKSAGVWSTALDADGTKAHLIVRSASVQQGVPAGWSLTCPADGSWLSSTPVDMLAGGLSYSSGYYATTAGTKGYLTYTRHGSASTAGMAFFSLVATIATMPEASRYVYAGQLGYATGLGLFGFVVRVANGGAWEIGVWQEGIGGYASLVTGGTGFANGDMLIVERFGNRITGHRIASGTHSIASSLSARVPVDNGYGYSFANSIAKSAFGIATDANSARLTKVLING
jgi:hypothetical protein